MQNDLQQIDAWLQANASRIYQESLNPPAAEADIAALETLAGQTLPEDFKQLYRWHNGMNTRDHIGSLFYAFIFNDIQKVATQLQGYRDSRTWRQDIASFLEEGSCDPRISPQNFVEQAGWLCFADDASRCGLYLDLNPSPSGRYGQIICIDLDYDTAFTVADSAAALAADVRADMQAGRYRLSAELLDKGQHFLEVDADIDVLNWHGSQRWRQD